MANGSAHPVLQFLRRLTDDEAGDPPDGELLARFAARRDEASFTALVQRHGAMVLAVCRRVLDNGHDAEDAFQATFLVLARQARSVAKPASVASWLYGVAYRTALRAKADAARRRAREREVPAMGAVDPVDEADRRDLQRLLDGELSRLPEKYRAPVVLCCLEGHTQDEAARRLGCPRKTVTTRLARALERLRRRLTRRGVVLSAAAVATVLGREAVATALPPALTEATIKAATLFGAGEAATGAVSARVATLTKEVLNAMWMHKVKTVGVMLLTVCALATAAGAFAYHLLAAEQPQAAKEEPPKAAVKGAEGPKEAPRKTDQEQLEGSWVLIAAEAGGTKAPPEELKKIDGKALFAGDKAVITQNGKTEELTFRLDPTKQPKEMNLILGKSEVHRAIYQLDGDTLKVCMSHPPQDRPTAFATKEGSKFPMLLVYKKTGESDQTTIQGTWTIVSIEAGGKVDDHITKGKLVFASDKMTHVKPDGTTGSQGTFKLDPTASPKELDGTALDGPNKDATFPGIYELDGDRLKFCFTQGFARPREFATQPGRKQLLYVLKRDTK
jgi:RNA polymerase sigma factor (sigma-70 family)